MTIYLIKGFAKVRCTKIQRLTVFPPLIKRYTTLLINLLWKVIEMLCIVGIV